MPPEDRFVPRFAAEPPQDLLPYGRWAQTPDPGVPGRLPAHRQRGRGARRARRGDLVPRPHAGTGARSCPATALTSPGLRALRLRQLRARRRRRGADRLPRRRRLHGRDGRGQSRLADRPLRRGRRHLARRAGQGRGDDARVGPPARRRRRRGDRRAGRPRGRPVRARRGPLHAAGPRRLPRRHARREALRPPRQQSSPTSRSTPTTTRTTTSDVDGRSRGQSGRDALDAPAGARHQLAGRDREDRRAACRPRPTPSS